MTRCRDVDDLVTAYVDGELDERRSSALRGHLRVCGACAERVEDEVRLREAAGSLEPLDPPADLWSAIDARLAEAEIADARRPRVWLWWQRALDGVRRYRIAVGVASAAAAAALAVWIVRGGGAGGETRHAAPAVVAELAPAVKSAANPASDPADGCGAVATHDEQVLCQMHEADRRYLDAIAELTHLVAAERSSWPAADAARFDAALAELDRAARDELKRLAVAAGAVPSSRDPLYAIYQAKIDLLSRAAVGGAP
ncbi:MAG TPA: zf-HC2 domain-containing protein [Kofleriaceae bacterium]|nr:zf-HC2 domain-containing protein [Kofleriaceae bacterium]